MIKVILRFAMKAKQGREEGGKRRKGKERGERKKKVPSVPEYMSS